MITMASQIDLYQEMNALSAGMVEAAQAQDWDRLVALEQSVSALRNELQRDDESIILSPAERELKAALIQQILDNDAEIRRHTEPWMEHVRGYLGDTRARRRIDQAYGAVQL